MKEKAATDTAALSPAQFMLKPSGAPNLDGMGSSLAQYLKKVVGADTEKRKAEVVKAKALINEEVRKFKLWQSSQGAVPYLAAMQAMAETIRESETKKMSQGLRNLGGKQKAAINELTTRITDALLQPIYYSMKGAEDIQTTKQKISTLSSIFQLKPLYKRRVLQQGVVAAPQVLPA